MPDKLSKLEALDLSGMKLEELPHEIFNLTSMRCLDLLGMEHLKTVDWRKIVRLPENLNWDRCGLDLLHEQLQDRSIRRISVSDASVFESLHQSSKLWKSCFLKFHFLVCPCEGGRKDICAHFKRKRFIYQRIYTRFEQSLSYERRLEVCGGKNSLEGVRGVLSVTKFFHLYGNVFVKALSNLGMKMDHLRECWIEKCHQLEYLFVGRMANIDVAVYLENLRVFDLAKLITVCRGKLGRGSFTWLKHVYLECCPKLINFFSSSIRLQNLELLEIKFCSRLERVFEEDSEVGQNAFPHLVNLCLWELRKLKSICCGHLPMLKKLKIRGCPLLEKLPLDNTNASATEVEIQGELKWWENIKWEGSIKPSYIRFKDCCLSKIYPAEVMVDDDDGRLRRRGEIVNAGHKRRQIPERDRPEGMAASRDGDDRQLRQGEVASAWSRRMRQQIWDCLRDDKISVFSVWGWEGVGKMRNIRT
ncbi:putative disease resistance protein At4g19050 [Magnolia sinica]|uniref:putative disease resistance protein At4g19050 n=1 Tax=Magnolia sinica TaxID=86752 RepID=UPI00265B6D1F|nr:putative disease resistance protein At4g19050 [Magnolia sinica]